MLTLGISHGPEIRSDATATLIEALTLAAGSTSARTWAAGAVETAAGLWARGLSSADVPSGVPVGPRLLAEVGRDLARRGEAVYLLDVAPAGRLRLLRATTYDVWGDSPDPADWWYRLSCTAPRTTRTVTAPAASVFHVRYATEPHSPARGIAPLTYASYTGQLMGALEQSLGYEAGGAVARLVALPEGHNNPPALADAIRTARGKTLLPETVANGWGDRNAAPKTDWKPARLGADPPAGLVSLRGAVESTVLSVFGIPSALGPAGLTDGTAQRESARRLWALTIQPLASLVAEELSRVLEQPVALTFGRAAQADLAAKARAVGGLVKAGVALDRAMGLAWGE